jgi:putative transposase
MPNPRRELLANQEIYHIYNKSIANEEIFNYKRSIDRALDLINFCRFIQELRYSRFKLLPGEIREEYYNKMLKKPPLVEIYAYSIMPTHYHILLKQLQENGIASFISKFQNAFAKYFNKKNNRKGGLFIRPFKAKRIASDELFLHVSRYIHLNPVTSYLINFDNLVNDQRSSFSYYLDSKHVNKLINTKLASSLVGSKNKYKKFVNNQVDYQRNLRKIKNYTLD